MCGVCVAYVFVTLGCLCDVFLLCMWYMCCLVKMCVFVAGV